jgi:hypothetical protein
MPCDAERFDERANIQRYVIGQGENGAFLDYDGFAESAATAGQPDEAGVVTDVFNAGDAGGALFAVEGRLDDDGLAGFEGA